MDPSHLISIDIQGSISALSIHLRFFTKLHETADLEKPSKSINCICQSHHICKPGKIGSWSRTVNCARRWIVLCNLPKSQDLSYGNFHKLNQSRQDFTVTYCPLSGYLSPQDIKTVTQRNSSSGSEQNAWDPDKRRGILYKSITLRTGLLHYSVWKNTPILLWRNQWLTSENTLKTFLLSILSEAAFLMV